MKQFFKFMFASMLGYILLGIIFLLIFIGIISVATKKDPVQVEKQSVLLLKLDKPITDRTANNPFTSLSIPDFDNMDAPGLDKYLKAIELAAEDDKILGIYFDITPMPSGFATLEEIRNKLLEFKESGKFIIAYGEVYDQKGYYMASVADTILLNPEGGLDFRGFVSEVAFLKGMLDKLDIEAQVLRGPNNKFKSAVEPLIYDEMSPANEEQVREYLGDLWNHSLKGIGEERGMTTEFMNTAADSLYVRTAADALEYGFVDGLFYKDQVLELLKNKLGIDQDDDIASIGVSKYVKNPDAAEKRRNKEKIAVIYAIGGIQSGMGDDQTIGSERISKAIRDARLDTTIKAIVLRVNSPGGSALASEVIWREIILSKEIKPVVASMGDVAASGGYYIACGADHILASPNTITGSIGVFGILPNMEGFFNNKMGVTFDRIKTNEHADYFTISRPLDDFETEAINESIINVYETFINHVAEGREMDVAMVDSLGRGRVWSGEDAVANGLVDELGGLERAIEVAAELAELENYRTIPMPEQKEFIDQVMESFNTQMQADQMLQEYLGTYYEHFKAFEEFSRMQGVQARLPFSMVIR